MTLSADGQTLLFREEGEAGGPTYAVYLRKTDGSTAVRLGDGLSLALSPDGKWALSSRGDNQADLISLPTGPGEPKPLPGHNIVHGSACWFSDGKRILVSGAETNRGLRLYVQDIDDDKIVAVTPEGTNGLSFASIARRSPSRGDRPDDKGYLFPIPSGDPRPLKVYSQEKCQSHGPLTAILCTYTAVVTCHQGLPVGRRHRQSNSLARTYASRSIRS